MTMASAIHKSVANLKKKLGEIEDPKVRKGVTDALRGLQKAVNGELRKIRAGGPNDPPWMDLPEWF
jgi:hypothetical protein